ncbi:hypothetical protein K493DRAFT_309665 [Basidiobolus meristosporus CBS 931.73]|uniref:Uncharacterized protein n=1 Tax=Basidiobolus meristosporus CBS 931.73 TaxID=1314790 RepID=A0A1Y1VRK7_9FUNG|nr:hypothetical protein K493DRAFT_309665 [Basidiobolus meristosporus CBS 931.73]|eukprot:ORX63918.1 hypothetical protein K493DRAFT_309665 [Basidiobolus meristosporus CBS 931.73]
MSLSRNISPNMNSPNPSTTNPPRGWYWSLEPSKSALAYYESNRNKAICPKCGPGYGFTKDSNGVGSATYGCFKCKHCSTKYKALQFWTECLLLSEDLLPIKAKASNALWAACSESEADHLPAAQLIQNHSHNLEIVISSSCEREHSGTSSDDESMNGTPAGSLYSLEYNKSKPDIALHSPSLPSVSNPYEHKPKHSRKQKAYSPLQQDPNSTSTTARILSLEQSLRSMEAKIASFDSRIDKLTILIENLLEVQKGQLGTAQSCSSLTELVLDEQKSLDQGKAAFQDTTRSLQQQPMYLMSTQ